MIIALAPPSLQAHICGDGICAAAEQTAQVCRLDCGDAGISLGYTPKDLLNNEVWNSNTGIAAVKSMTLSQLGWSQTSSTIKTIAGCGQPSCQVKVIEGSFDSGSYTAPLESVFGDGTGALLPNVTFDVSNDIRCVIPWPLNGNNERSGMIGPINSESIQENMVAHWRLPVCNIIQSTDYATNTGYTGISEVAAKSRTYVRRVALELDADVEKMDTQRHNLIYALARRNSKAITLLKRLIENEGGSPAGTLSLGVGLSGSSKNGWATWVSAAIDDRVTSFVASNFQFEDFTNAFDRYVSDFACDYTELPTRYAGDPLSHDEFINASRFSAFNTTGAMFRELYEPATFMAQITADSWGVFSGDTLLDTHDNQFFLGAQSDFFNRVKTELPSRTIYNWRNQNVDHDNGDLIRMLSDLAFQKLLSKTQMHTEQTNYTQTPLGGGKYNLEWTIEVYGDISSTGNTTVKMHYLVNTNSAGETRKWHNFSESNLNSFTCTYTGSGQTWKCTITNTPLTPKPVYYYFQATDSGATQRGYGVSRVESSIPKITNEASFNTCIF